MEISTYTHIRIMFVPTTNLDCPNKCFHLLPTAKWWVEPSECWTSPFISHWIGYKGKNSNSEPLVSRLRSVSGQCSCRSDILQVAAHHWNGLCRDNSTIHMPSHQSEVHDRKGRPFSGIFLWGLSTECLPLRYWGLRLEPFVSHIRFEALKAKTCPYDELTLGAPGPWDDLFGLQSWYEQ